MNERYATIVADPPWPHPGTGRIAAGWRKSWNVKAQEPLRYDSMSLDAIAALPVRELATANARLFLWATNTRMPDAYPILSAWGFRYKQTLVWRKPDGNPTSGSVAPNAEFLLVASKGSPPVIGRFPNAVTSHPRGGLVHSQKPDVFLDLIEQVSPGPYLELFARRQRLGWDTWGNQALEHVALDRHTHQDEAVT